MSPQPRPRLVLAAGGRVLHRTSCSVVRRAPDMFQPHLVDVASREAALAVVAQGLQPCKTCKPLKALAWWEHQQHKRRVTV